MFDETIRQKVNGKSISEILNERNILPGIKVDKGAKKLALSKDETITEGLDGLRERLKNIMNWVQDLRNGELSTKFPKRIICQVKNL